MRDLKNWGGLAALICAATYIFGFVILLTLLAPSGYGMAQINPAEVVVFIVENTGLILTWNFAIYVINGLALAALAVALGAYFAPHAPGIAQMVQTFGALWATLVVGAGMVANVGIAGVTVKHTTNAVEAVQMWELVSLVENGLGGGNEIAGGVWAILIAVAIFITRQMPKSLALFSGIIGVSGLLTVIPQLGDTPGAVFGLGYIVWFAWVSFLLLFKVAPSIR